MNTGLGIPELAIFVMALFFWIIPVAAALWALGTLYRIRASQDAMRMKLETIERLLQRTP